VFTARYALSPYIKQIRFVFKGLMFKPGSTQSKQWTLNGYMYITGNLLIFRVYLVLFENQL
jgi:hypothetical protein